MFRENSITDVNLGTFLQHTTTTTSSATDVNLSTFFQLANTTTTYFHLLFLAVNRNGVTLDFFDVGSWNSSLVTRDKVTPGSRHNLKD